MAYKPSAVAQEPPRRPPRQAASPQLGEEGKEKAGLYGTWLRMRGQADPELDELIHHYVDWHGIDVEPHGAHEVGVLRRAAMAYDENPDVEADLLRSGVVNRRRLVVQLIAQGGSGTAAMAHAIAGRLIEEGLPTRCLVTSAWEGRVEPLDECLRQLRSAGAGDGSDILVCDAPPVLAAWRLYEGEAGRFLDDEAIRALMVADMMLDTYNVVVAGGAGQAPEPALRGLLEEYGVAYAVHVPAEAAAAAAGASAAFRGIARTPCAFGIGHAIRRIEEAFGIEAPGDRMGIQEAIAEARRSASQKNRMAQGR